jgi:hypothetical protein
MRKPWTRVLGHPATRMAVPLALLVAVVGAVGTADAVRRPARAMRVTATAGAATAKEARHVVLPVAHGPVTPDRAQYVDAPPAGPSVGDVRTYYFPLTQPNRKRTIGYITGTLTTTATDRPKVGFELRTADLVFVVGRPKDQLVVGGVSAYPVTAPTIATRSVTTRPVLGGSGRYAGARGWCVSTHRGDGTWRHVFHLTL